MNAEFLKKIIAEYTNEGISEFFRISCRFYSEDFEGSDEYNDDVFENSCRLGIFKFDSITNIILFSFKIKGNLTERRCRKLQYEKAKKILKSDAFYRGGIFIFYDEAGSFRFSLVYPQYAGHRITYNNFRRFTYYVNRELTNRTFLHQIGLCHYESYNDILKAFSITALTKDFYSEFYPHFESIADNIHNLKGKKLKRSNAITDFALLFIIRVIFLGFIQKKKWLGDDINFMQNYLKEYQKNQEGKNKFYIEWLEPLFFEALNSQPGTKVAYGRNTFPRHIEEILQLAPYLNGGLFKRHKLDNENFFIPDNIIKEFFDYIFSYNFTIEENKIDDEDLELNPEFLGIIFERLVNMADGAVYTPRIEVDYMCRLSLVKWIEKNANTKINIKDLYELFFREIGDGTENDDDQLEGSFSRNQIKEIIELLEKVTVCDPAVGSGAFPVGMLYVIDEIESNLLARIGQENTEENRFARRKRIIGNSLYGVEVKEWAVWITQLRLWITLFIDAPDEMKLSMEPILPSLDFKIRQGDSVVQRIGKKIFPVQSHASIPKAIKDKVTKLKKRKIDYFNNKADGSAEAYNIIRNEELSLFREILNAEISDKKKHLKALEYGSDEPQMEFFGETPSAQEALPLNKNEIAKLKQEISELIEELESLQDDHPLIWNIEFAEIFSDRDGFDIVIGNPPYVRQEDIADPLKKITDNKEYKNLLAESVYNDFPEYFKTGNRVTEKIDSKSDLYSYFYLRGLRLLNPMGIHCYICSNSWLDVGYGTWMQKFFLSKVPMHFIIDNHEKRSFFEADVNTIISLFDAPQKKGDMSKVVKFAAFKRSFEDAVFTENLLYIENASSIQKNEILRVYPIRTEELLESGMIYETDEDDEDDTKHIKEKETRTASGKYKGEKWGGKFLRAPDIFFIILEKGKDKLVKLGDITKIKFGIKTGANEFFYLTKQKIQEWGIEDEFLKPVIKSPKDCKSILIKNEELDLKIFYCNKTKKELKGTKALKYIEWGEKQEIKIKQGGDEGKSIIGFHNISTVKSRNNWFSLGNRKIPDFIVPAGFGSIYRFFKNNGVLADKRLYEGYSEINTDLMVNLINSTLFSLCQEVNSRVGLGDGLLDLTVYEVKATYFLNPITIKKIPSLNFQREIKSIFEECGIDPTSEIPISEQIPKPLPDRAELDKVIFDVLGLTEEERIEVYRAVCQLVWNRISRAKG